MENTNQLEIGNEWMLALGIFIFFSWILMRSIIVIQELKSFEEQERQKKNKAQDELCEGK